MIRGNSKTTIIYTGGGTAGHIYPGLAVVSEMIQRTGTSLRHCWIGSNRGMDRRIVEASGVRFYGIPAGKLRRYLSLRNVFDVFLVAAGFIRAFLLLFRLRPALVFSKGGYVTVPVVLAARLLRIPSISHESDAEPGLATRINSRFASRVLVSFNESLAKFPASVQARIEVSGNPVRPALFEGNDTRGSEKAGPGTKPVLLVLGGSQGARQINTLIAGCLNGLLEHCRVVHQHGSWDAPPDPAPGYLPFDFIGDDLADLLSAAALVVCRAGASTLWELAALGKPSILIPLGTESSRGDQQTNARIFGERGASVVLSGKAGPEELQKEVSTLLHDPVRLETMQASARRLAEINGVHYISDIIQKEITTNGRTGYN